MRMTGTGVSLVCIKTAVSESVSRRQGKRSLSPEQTGRTKVVYKTKPIYKMNPIYKMKPIYEMK